MGASSHLWSCSQKPKQSLARLARLAGSCWKGVARSLRRSPNTPNTPKHSKMQLSGTVNRPPDNLSIQFVGNNVQHTISTCTIYGMRAGSWASVSADQEYCPESHQQRFWHNLFIANRPFRTYVRFVKLCRVIPFEKDQHACEVVTVSVVSVFRYLVSCRVLFLAHIVPTFTVGGPLPQETMEGVLCSLTFFGEY